MDLQSKESMEGCGCLLAFLVGEVLVYGALLVAGVWALYRLKILPPLP